MKSVNEIRIYEWAEQLRQTNYFEFAALEPEVKKIWWAVQQRIDRGEPAEGPIRETLFGRILKKLGR